MAKPKKKKAVKAKPEVKLAPCFNCKKMVDTADDFCSGCKTVVCETCNTASLYVPWGGHAKEAHLKHYDDDGNEIDPYDPSLDDDL